MILSVVAFALNVLDLPCFLLSTVCARLNAPVSFRMGNKSQVKKGSSKTSFLTSTMASDFITSAVPLCLYRILVGSANLGGSRQVDNAHRVRRILVGSVGSPSRFAVS